MALWENKKEIQQTRRASQAAIDGTNAREKSLRIPYVGRLAGGTGVRVYMCTCCGVGVCVYVCAGVARVKHLHRPTRLHHTQTLTHDNHHI